MATDTPKEKQIMEIFNMKRGTGKTTKLIRMSGKNNIPIGYVRTSQRQFLLDVAKSIGVKIPEPIYLEDLKNGKKVDKIYLDDIDKTLMAYFNCSIEAVTISDKEDDKQYIIETLKDSLKQSVNDYGRYIHEHKFNEAFNIMKNIQMITQIIKDIVENENLSKVLNDLSKCWTSLDDQDEIIQAFVGERYVNTFKELTSLYGKFVAIEVECIKQNLYYNEFIALRSTTEKTSDNSDDIFNTYKKLLNLKQYKGKTYLNTIIEKHKI